VAKRRFTSKTYLKLLIVAGILAVIGGGAGTFATFNAETTNAGNTFATGTLFLHNTNGSTTCTSEANSGNLNTTGSTGCAVLFTVTNPTGTSHADIALKNAGTIDASSLSFDIPSACADSKPTIATLNGAVNSGDTIPSGAIPINSDLTQALSNKTPIELNDGTNTETFTVNGDTASNATSVPVSGHTTYTSSFASGTPIEINFGGASLCGQLKLSIAEMTSGFGSYVSCVYGGTSDGTNGCISPTTTLSNVPASLQSLGGTLAAGQTRYFRIFVSLPTPNGLANSAQNDQSKFDLLWDIGQ